MTIDIIKPEKHKFYNNNWHKASKQFLKNNRYCAFHLQKNEYVKATLVDHIIPHRYDRNLFWDTNNWQPLCKKCHDNDKRRFELATYGRKNRQIKSEMACDKKGNPIVKRQGW